MTINTIIEKHYSELQSMCWDTDKTISQSKTSDDVFQDVIVTALKKYRNKEIDEEEGLKYIKDNFCLEMHFQPKREDKVKIVYMDYIENIKDMADS